MPDTIEAVVWLSSRSAGRPRASCGRPRRRPAHRRHGPRPSGCRTLQARPCSLESAPDNPDSKASPRTRSAGAPARRDGAPALPPHRLSLSHNMGRNRQAAVVRDRHDGPAEEVCSSAQRLDTGSATMIRASIRSQPTRTSYATRSPKPSNAAVEMTSTATSCRCDSRECPTGCRRNRTRPEPESEHQPSSVVRHPTSFVRLSTRGETGGNLPIHARLSSIISCNVQLW